MIPTYEEIMLPLLQYLSDKKVHSLGEAQAVLAKHFKLAEQEVRELLPSGKQPVFRNRLGWARTYLKKAGLLSSPHRAHFVITESGLKLLGEKPSQITNNTLKEYPEFLGFIQKKSTSRNDKKIEPIQEEIDSDKTPEEVLEYAFIKLKKELGREILDTIKACSPEFFENLIIDLLIAMGYGGSRKDAGEAMGKSGDGGIDGIIKEDKLGLDIIYLQAKRWENAVPVREIRDFTGALASKKAKKGIFITTSYFPKSVYEFIDKVEYKIVLIDGELLTDLMFENNVGLSTTNTYAVKTIDSDYFEEG